MFPTIFTLFLLWGLYEAVSYYLKIDKKDTVLKEIKSVELDSEVVDLKQQLNKAKDKLEKKKSKL